MPDQRWDLKRLQRLDRKKVREELGLQLLEGRRVVAEAIDAGMVSQVFCLEEAVAHWSEVSGAVPVQPVEAHALSRLADVKTPQEVVAVGPLPRLLPAPELLQEHKRIVVLDGLQDPGNVGAIARTALAFGCSAILALPGTADLTSPKVLRASAGALLRLSLGVGTSAVSFDSCDHVVALPVVRGGEDIRGLPVPSCYALILGNEGGGASVRPSNAVEVTIPMPGPVESLNVAAACAVILSRWA